LAKLWGRKKKGGYYNERANQLTVVTRKGGRTAFLFMIKKSKKKTKGTNIRDLWTKRLESPNGGWDNLDHGAQ